MKLRIALKDFIVLPGSLFVVTSKKFIIESDHDN